MSLIEDPLDSSKFFIGSYAEPMYGAQEGPGTLVNVHPKSKCQGTFCCIHRPSSHHMVNWPMNWRDDRGLMERICPCGVGHPDPDDLAFHVRAGRYGMGVHGCCGCCISPAE